SPRSALARTPSVIAIFARRTRLLHAGAGGTPAWRTGPGSEGTAARRPVRVGPSDIVSGDGSPWRSPVARRAVTRRRPRGGEPASGSPRVAGEAGGPEWPR